MATKAPRRRRSSGSPSEAHGRRAPTRTLVARLTDHQLFLAAPTVAELRLSCRRIGHPLAGSAHSSDLWIGASTIGIRAVMITADQIFASTPGLSID